MKNIIKIAFLPIVFIALSISNIAAYTCGQTSRDIAETCECEATNNQAVYVADNTFMGHYCCGFNQDGKCRAYESKNQYACGETYDTSWYNQGYETVPEGTVCNCSGGGWVNYNKFYVIIKFSGICCGWTNSESDQCLNANPNENNVLCGETYTKESKNQCICGGDSGKDRPTGKKNAANEELLCCGWLRNGECKDSDAGINDIEVDSKTLNNLNPISIGSGSVDLSTPGAIISRALGGFIFPIAGIILFLQLLFGGFQMLTGATNSKSIDEGKQKITAAIIGFLLLFAAYWIAQLLELIFGIRILS